MSRLTEACFRGDTCFCGASLLQPTAMSPQSTSPNTRHRCIVVPFVQRYLSVFPASSITAASSLLVGALDPTVSSAWPSAYLTDAVCTPPTLPNAACRCIAHASHVIPSMSSVTIVVPVSTAAVAGLVLALANRPTYCENIAKASTAAAASHSITRLNRRSLGFDR